MYALSQVVHSGEVFAPLVVDDLQHHVALEIGHCLLTDQFGFGGIFVFDAFDQAFFDVLTVNRIVRLQPGLDVFVQSEFGSHMVLQSRDVHCSSMLSGGI